MMNWNLGTVAGMTCITVLGAIQLWKYGDGTTLSACVTAIAALAGVSVGSAISKSKEE